MKIENVNRRKKMKKFSLLNASLAIVIAIILISDPKKMIHQTIIIKSLVFVGVAIFGYVGAFIGEILRNIAIPDSIIVRGGMKNILFSKLFWAAGPQAIGAAIGGALGGGIIVKLLIG